MPPLHGYGNYKYIKRGLPKEMPEHRAVLHQVDPRDNENELVVHHIDGNKANNDPHNLVWMTNSEHVRLHRLGENHFPCAGTDNANYRHGMCVGGQSKEYRQLHNRLAYERHREERLAKQKAYAQSHKEHILWYHKLRDWKMKLEAATTDERRAECLSKIHLLEENPI